MAISLGVSALNRYEHRYPARRVPNFTQIAIFLSAGLKGGYYFVLTIIQISFFHSLTIGTLRMTKIVILALIVSISFLTADAHAAGRSATPPGGSASVCSSASPVTDFLIKAEASNHINRGDPRTSGYSLICGRECVQFITQFFYFDGEPAAHMGITVNEAEATVVMEKLEHMELQEARPNTRLTPLGRLHEENHVEVTSTYR